MPASSSGSPAPTPSTPPTSPTPSTRAHDVVDARPRRVLALASAALVVLAAEPLYLLVDVAVVGRLGATALAGLAVGGVVLAQVASLGTVLAYGTTARAARRHGVGDRAGAVAEGAAATWLALISGGVVVLGIQLTVGPVTRALGGGGEVAAAAESWLRIAVWGAPGILVALAGHGWMRGVQETRRPVLFVLSGVGLSALACPLLVHGVGTWPGLGLDGSAVANVGAQTIVTVLFVTALVREGAPVRPSWTTMRAQLGPGRDLLLRSAAFQACFLSATAVAARSGTESLAAHQIVLQLWVFMSTVLDSVAIAAQSLVGAALGASSVAAARHVAGRVIRYGLVLGVVAALLFALGAGAIPGWFTPDPAVRDAVPQAWWFFVALLPVAAYVFAIDGVLLGAGDAAFLRRVTIASALLAFLPLVWLSFVLEWGLVGIWAGLSLFVLARAVTGGLRVRGSAWTVTGATR